MDEYNRFSKGLFEWIGYNTKVFTYQNVEREAGESKWSFAKLLNYGIDGLISFNNKPLRMMIYLGMFTFSLSVLYIVYLLINIMISGVNIPGYFTTIAAILLLGGIQLMSIGVIGEYIGRIYYEVKRRPKYIVQATNIEPDQESEAHNTNDNLKTTEAKKEQTHHYNQIKRLDLNRQQTSYQSSQNNEKYKEHVH